MADERTPDQLPEETKEKYRLWWSSRSPEERAQLRALNGQSVTVHEAVYLTGPDGLPLAVAPREAGGPPAVFHLPDFLLSDEGPPE